MKSYQVFWGSEMTGLLKVDGISLATLIQHHRTPVNRHLSISLTQTHTQTQLTAGFACRATECYEDEGSDGGEVGDERVDARGL